MDGVLASHNPVLQEVLDLRPYINSSAAAVQESFSLDRTYVVFRTLGLRHLVVVDRHNHVKGIVTRKVNSVQSYTHCTTTAWSNMWRSVTYSAVQLACQHQVIFLRATLQDLLGFRLDEAVEKEKGASTGLVSLSRPASSASELAQQGTVYDD